MNKLFITILLTTTSCASIIEGSTQGLNVKLEGADSAECRATSAKQTQTFTAPTTIQVMKSYYPAEITCSANGTTGSVKLLSDVANWGYGGAILGVGVGAVIDSGTGAAFEYPAEITVTIGETKILGKTAMNSNKDIE